jgi:hypothetical protein
VKVIHDVRFQREVVEEDKLPASPPFKRMKELKTEVNIS